jgi:hypothetical protein
MDFPTAAPAGKLARQYSAAHTIDVAAGESGSVRLAVPAPARGVLAAPRVRLLTRFPLGLFTAWSYWAPDARAIVYPTPEALDTPLPMAGRPGGQAGSGSGNDEFAGIRPYLRASTWNWAARWPQNSSKGARSMTWCSTSSNCRLRWTSKCAWRA